MRKCTVYTEDFEGHDYELDFEAVSAVLKAKVGDKVVMSYLVYDNCRDIEDMMGEGCGELISFHRDNRSNHHKGLEALGNNNDGEPDLDAVWSNHWAEAIRRYIECVLSDHADADTVVNYEETQNYEPRDGETLAERARRYVTADAEEAYSWNYVSEEDTMRDVLEKMWSEPAYFPGNPDAQLLSVYSHGGEHWSLAGGGMQCRWDTNNSAGVWIPDEFMSKELAALPENERSEKARAYCQSFLDSYNDIISGQVFGCVTQVYEEDGTKIGDESRWGFVGSDHAEESLKSDFFDPV
jgi:hypothetical protein